MNKCKYCNQEANFTLKSGSFCCHSSWNQCPAIKTLNSKGVKAAHAEGKMNYDKLKGRETWLKGKTSYSDSRINSKFEKNEFFVQNSKVPRYQIRNIVILENLLPYECQKCHNNGNWLDKPITLDLDHINGINNDHKLENLRFLCPNCHSQTDTFRNKQGKKIQISDEMLIEALTKEKSIYAALQSLNLVGANNYKRCCKILSNMVGVNGLEPIL